MKKEEYEFRKIVKDVERLFVSVFIAIIMLFTFAFIMASLASCGARKVEKKQIKEETEKKEKIVVENDITATDNITITSKSFVIDSTKEEIEEIEITPIDLLKPAYYENKELKNTKLVKRKIKRNKVLSETNNTNTKHDSKIQDKSKKTVEKANKRTKNEKVKQSEREQFDIIGMILQYWWLWLIILLALWLLKKYKDKVTFI